MKNKLRFTLLIAFTLASLTWTLGQSPLDISYNPRILPCAQKDTVKAQFTCNFNGTVSPEILMNDKNLFSIIKVGPVKNGKFEFIYKLDAIAPDTMKVKWTVLTSDDPTGCVLKGATVLSNIRLDCQCAPQIEILYLEHETCFNCEDGEIEVQASGMLEPISYKWNNGATGPLLTFLAPGEYMVECRGANNQLCIDTLVVNIDKYNCEKTSVEYTQTDVSCAGDCNGKIEILGLENDAPIQSVIWNDSMEGSIREDLCPDTYIANIKGMDQCPYQEQIVISSPDSLTIDTLEVIDTLGAGKGIIVVEVMGGTKGYNYFISKNDTALSHDLTSNVFTDLDNGCYDIKVVDTQDCEAIIKDVCIETSTSNVNIVVPNIKIFPNPSNGILKLSNLDLNEIKYISIMDMRGAENKKLEPSKLLDIQDINQGMYILKIVANNWIWTKKIMIEK